MMSLIQNLAVWLVIVTVLLGGAINSALNLRARPQEEGTATVYRMKLLGWLPRFLLLVYLTAALITMCGTTPSVTRWLVLVALEAVAITMYLKNWPYKIVVDAVGIHSCRFLHHEVTIAWSDLAQLKRSGGHWKSLKDATYRFRSSRGTTIKVAESDFETDDILNRVRSLHPCPEKVERYLKGGSPVCG